MLNKLKNTKISTVIAVILLGYFFYSTMGLEGVQPDDISEQISQREPWLRETSQSISDYMRDNESTTTVFSPGNIFLSLYTSPNFSTEKLESLQSYLRKMDWYALPKKDYRLLSKSSVSESNERSFDEVVVLCKNNASILIWMDDAKDNHIDPSTIVKLIYDSQLPCYEQGKVM